jgi:DNA-binding MurR/RpiR family transcriptional regulator
LQRLEIFILDNQEQLGDSARAVEDVLLAREQEAAVEESTDAGQEAAIAESTIEGKKQQS